MTMTFKLTVEVSHYDILTGKTSVNEITDEYKNKELSSALEDFLFHVNQDTEVILHFVPKKEK